MTLRSIPQLQAAGLVAADAAALAPVAERYAVAVTAHVAGLIDRDDPADPIARQYVPDERELTLLPQELADPIGDHAHMPIEGVVHRYPDRALLKVVHACPVYCRFCFRREMVGPGGKTLTGAMLDEAIAYIAATPAIREVILTGGDPFMLPARKAAELTARLAAIQHVKTLRWHTRVPFAAPSRVTDAFAQALRAPGVATYVGVHANHPREFAAAAVGALARLADVGVSLVSQSVLLRGINDDVETLAALMRAFVENRVKPYYLHHPDLAPGTSHFRLSVAEGRKLVEALRGRLSGLAQPHYVIDIPGGYGKSPIGPSFLSEDGRAVRDYRGGAHALIEPH
ncbi:MAG: lysine-2,3-aminomutase-like protein [Beijerinckiaceae bacterium]